jgi:hypothetical protein
MAGLGLMFVLILVLFVAGRFNEKKEKKDVPNMIWERGEEPVSKSTSRFFSKSTGSMGFNRLLQGKSNDIRSRFLDWSDNCKKCDRLYQESLQSRRYAVS